MPQIKVLHVTECLGGGVTSAINTYVENSDFCEHYMFASIREGDETGEEGTHIYKESKFVKRDLFFIFSLYNFYLKVKPDVVHLHSSFAGLIVRMFTPIPSQKIVYTPHAFAFLRDDHPVILRFYKLVENLLSWRCRVIAGCGLDEKLLAEKLWFTKSTEELINVCGDLPVFSPRSKNSKLQVTMLGRVSPQKDFRFFAEVARKVGPCVKFAWLGGGDKEGVAELEAAGVEVSGWVSRREALESLWLSDVYFHSALWDGFPVSVLEAAEYELPMVLRSIGPFRAEGLHVLDTADQIAECIKKLSLNDASTWKLARENQEKVALYHSTDNLRARLAKLYSMVAHAAG